MFKDSVAIIGGAGFVGTNLARNLKKTDVKYVIYDIDLRDGTENIVKLDVENLNSLRQIKGVDTIINLAAVHRDDVKPISRYDSVNIGGAENICDAARRYNINKIIFTSSVAVYGFAQSNITEDGEHNYFNDYGRTKSYAEEVYKKWQSEDCKHRTLVIIRPTVIFGEGNRGNVFNLLRQIASRKFVMFGNGENCKSMAYVENVSAFLEHSISFKPGLHIYNYIDKPDFDMNTLISESRSIMFGKRDVGFRLPRFIGIIIGYTADIVARIINKPLAVSSIRVKKFMTTTQFSSSVFKTGFIPPISIEEGLARTIRYEFLEDNKDKRTFYTE